MTDVFRRKILSKVYPVMLLSSMALALLFSNSWAYGERSGGRQGGPPQEAIDACNDQSAGAIVEFVSPRGDKIKGTCTERNGQLVAVPEGRGKGQRGPVQ